MEDEAAAAAGPAFCSLFIGAPSRTTGLRELNDDDTDNDGAGLRFVNIDDEAAAGRAAAAAEADDRLLSLLAARDRNDEPRRLNERG